jgi:threonine aldolase
MHQEPDPITRRNFLLAGAALPLATPTTFSPETLGMVHPKGVGDPLVCPDPATAQELADLQGVVKLTGDGPSMTPLEWSHALSTVVGEGGVEADYYSNGGIVEALEMRMAGILGKERAVFLPTGTLANHLAVRALAGDRTRVVVQKESHLYNDSGDCAQVLSNLNLIPMASSDGTFTLEEVQAAVSRAEGGRVRTGIGAISIESPIRRRLGKLFEYDEMKRVCGFARSEGIGIHLDGARLFMASGYTGISPSEYSSHFDTVYVSMWKYFNAPSGAILAGSRELLDDLYHTRRMFGGGLPYAWPFAAVALRSIDGFQDRFKTGVEAGEALKASLHGIPGFRIEEIPNGSNLFKLHADGGDLEALREGLAPKGVLLPGPNPNFRGFSLAVNETLTRKPVADIVRAFTEVWGG